MSQQKYALVTGASSGIGYELSIAFAEKGYKVFACAPESVLFQMKPLEQYGAITFVCDITNVNDIKKASELVKKETGGRLDILYNNAGISFGSPAIDLDENKVDKIFQVNVIGHMNMTKAMADYVIAAKGSIIFTSSVAAKVPLSWVSHYNATKAAIDMYAKTLHMEMKPLGVKVHSVITGAVDTAICDSNRSSSMAGSHFDVDGIYESMTSSASMSRVHRTRDSPREYARGIVNMVTQKSDPGFNLFKGGAARILSFVAWLLPLWLVQRIIAKYFKQLTVFSNLKKKVKAQDKLKKN